MLERMADYFNARLSGYDEHMMSEISGGKKLYPFTASLLPAEKGARVLDLGCGTGLELEAYFRINSDATITGIDLSAGMLTALREKFPDKEMELIQGSYFDVPLGKERFDASVSVLSLHHFTAVQKLDLYRKLNRALTESSFFVLTDLFAQSDILEQEYFPELERLKTEQKLEPDEFYHFDTPLTLTHETEVLQMAGFSDIQVVKRWGATSGQTHEK